jgi:hypothetical protein
MNRNRSAFLAVAAVAAALILTSALTAGERAEKRPGFREATLTGKVVDLHCYMTGRFPSTDAVKCTRECLMVGVPAALETEDGLVMIGKGPKGAGREVAPFALQNVELKGKLYERRGVRYIDFASVKAAQKLPPVEPPEEPEVQDPETDDWEQEEYDDTTTQGTDDA